MKMEMKMELNSIRKELVDGLLVLQKREEEEFKKERQLMKKISEGEIIEWTSELGEIGVDVDYLKDLISRVRFLDKKND